MHCQVTLRQVIIQISNKSSLKEVNKMTSLWWLDGKEAYVLLFCICNKYKKKWIKQAACIRYV